jgi:hypothetical protein
METLKPTPNFLILKSDTKQRLVDFIIKPFYGNSDFKNIEIQHTPKKTLKTDGISILINKENAKAIIENLNEFVGKENKTDLKEENERLKAVNQELLSIAKAVHFMFSNEANYPEGTRGYYLAQEAKAAIENNVL